MTDLWSQVTGRSPDMTALAVILRGALAYFVFLAVIRLGGSRTAGELTTLDLVVAITIGTIIGNSLTDYRSSLWIAVLAAATWIGLHWLIAMAALKFPWLRTIVSGRPRVLIDRGKIQEQNLAKAQVNIDRLTQLLREKNVAKLADVEFAILEPDGGLSVVKKAEVLPITPQTLGLRVPPSTLPRTVVADGKVRKENLSALGLSESWLMRELHKQGVKKLKDVVLAQAGDQGSLHLDLKNDVAPVTKPKDNQKMLAVLKKCSADLASFALETKNPEAKELYLRCQERLNQAVKLVNPYLQQG